MIRIVAKFFALTIVLVAFLPVQPSSAENVAFVSATGSGGACTQTAPCGTIFQAIITLETGGRIVCGTPVSETGGFGFNGGTWVFDCPSAVMHGNLTISGNAVLKFQHMSFSPVAGNKMFVSAGGGGTLIYDDCVLEDATGTPLDVEPAFPLNLVIKNSRISNNAAAGVLIKPASGGSVTATFDGVTITNNAGGLRTDTTNGAVRVDISNSTISNNANNGLIAIGGAGGQNMVSVGNGVIASNSQAGIEASGATAAVLVNNTLLDSNAGGAISAVSGGRILTYQNNRTIGLPGTGFTGTASPN
jgi:hypothetical protein